MSDHVIYESRLELSRLLWADFDPMVWHIVAQPFLLRSTVDGTLRRHVPDYLLLTERGPVVVDVKPRHRVARPEVAATFEWTRSAVVARGWRFEVWSEPPAIEMDNVRFLAGYRRSWLFDVGLLDSLKGAELDGVTLGLACRSVSGWSLPVVRSGLLHLLWRGYLATDLSRPLSAGHVLRRRVG